MQHIDKHSKQITLLENESQKIQAALIQLNQKADSVKTSGGIKENIEKRLADIENESNFAQVKETMSECLKNTKTNAQTLEKISASLFSIFSLIPPDVFTESAFWFSCIRAAWIFWDSFSSNVICLECLSMCCMVLERVDIMVFVDSSILWLSIKIFEIVFISFDIIFVDSMMEDMPFPVPVALAIFAGRASLIVFGFADLDDLMLFDFAGRASLIVFDLDDLTVFGFTDRLTGDFFDFFFLAANTMCET